MTRKLKFQLAAALVAAMSLPSGAALAAASDYAFEPVRLS